MKFKLNESFSEAESARIAQFDREINNYSEYWYVTLIVNKGGYSEFFSNEADAREFYNDLIAKWSNPKPRNGVIIRLSKATVDAHHSDIDEVNLYQ